MHYKTAILLLFTAVCVPTKSDSDSENESNVCGLSDSMQGTWTGLSAELQDTNEKVVVNGDNIKVTTGGVTREFLCIQNGLFYGEYLWQSKDIDDHYLCVLKTDIGSSHVQRKIATSTGTFDPIPIPEKTDLEYTSLCTDTTAIDVLKLRKQGS